jgi:hypothetical protein
LQVSTPLQNAPSSQLIAGPLAQPLLASSQVSTPSQGSPLSQTGGGAFWQLPSAGSQYSAPSQWTPLLQSTGVWVHSPQITSVQVDGEPSQSSFPSQSASPQGPPALQPGGDGVPSQGLVGAVPV